MILPFNAARLKERFKLGDLTYVKLAPAIGHPKKWEMVVTSRLDGEVQVESKKGELKLFSSLEAARNYAEQIGFKSMQIGW